MENKKKIISTIIILTLIIYYLFSILIQNNVFAVTQVVSTDIENIDESKYPGIKSKIKELQRQYPNWKFKLLYTKLDWNEVIRNEYTGHGTSPKNLVYKSDKYKGEWICPICGDKAYDNGNWRCASEQAIKYMMDPRASLNASDIFQFEELTNVGCDINTLKNMTRGTFLEGHEQGIINVANNNNVNAYYIVARLIQEQGTSGTVLTSGAGYNGQYVGYYNAFNIAASGNSSSAIILNALNYAQKKGWTSLDASIDGGISFLAKQYIQKGQNTLYLQKFDVEETNGYYSHQYMQNILAAQNEGMTLKNTYSSINSIASPHTFVIPVYENMPVEVSKRPDTNGSNVKPTPNEELVRVNVGSSLRIRNNPNGDKTIGWLYKDEVVTRLEKATSKVGGTYWDKIKKTDGTIGYVARETYENEAEYKLYLVPINQSDNNNNGNNDGNGNSNDDYMAGDVNGDKKITSSDYVLIKDYIMESSSLSDTAKKAADYNKDGKITSSDYVLIKDYIMEE